MTNKTMRIIGIIFILLMFLLIFETSSNAASFSASISKTTVTVGDTFSVTVKANNAAGMYRVSASNSNATVNSGSASEFLENSSATITYKANKAGTVTVTATATDMTDLDDDTKPVKGTKTFTVTIKEKSSGGSSSGTTNKKPTTNTTPPKEEVKKSTDSTLSALSIKEGTITPEFKKDVKEYSLTIPYETTDVNVNATPNDSKAKVSIDGNKDLKEGENTVEVLVTAENGTSTTYTIKVTRKRVPIALKTLVVKYQNENGELIENPLNPEFNFDILEYTLQDLEYWVEKLSIEAMPNIEGATVDIKGAENLQVGENTITINVKIAEEITPEGQEPKEETIIYTIKVNKTEEPTLIAKIQDWFKGIMGTVGTWFNNNQSKLIVGALGVCIMALIGLSIYIVVDYNKYKDIIVKVKKVSEINANSNIVEEIAQQSNIVEEKNVEDNNKNDRQKGGKHF